MAESKQITCQICGKQHPREEMIPGGAIRGSLVAEIKHDNPNWTDASFICRDDLDVFRAQYVQHSLERERGELTELDRAVLKSMRDEESLVQNLNREFEGKLTFGERIADKVAEFGGSWKFIIMFCGFLALWMLMNSYAVWSMVVRHGNPFDAFPFILLNLMLSGVAGLQAPVIMMSQNRQEAKDRLRAEHDYQVNLKAELEIRNLHEKLDHLLNTQWQRLLEIQQIQTDLIEELARPNGGKGAKTAAGN
jgi:uncharacterized membrane protein